MKIYLVSVDEYDYDEYDSFVIAANSHNEARKIAVENCVPDQKANFLEKSNIVYCGMAAARRYTEPQIILGSFNAG